MSAHDRPSADGGARPGPVDADPPAAEAHAGGAAPALPEGGGIPLAEVPERLTGGAVAIGNFDGVHRGHQAVMRAAADAGRPAVALTFEPHPRDVFGRGPVFRLTPPVRKAALVAALGLDGTVVAPFDRAFANQSADTFVRDVLAGTLKVKALAVGADFSFGKDRSGNAARLAGLGERHGFKVHVVGAKVDDTGETISSTRIRAHLEAGELDEAAVLAGHRYGIVAEVVHGEKRGRQMNYPTANQSLGPDNTLRHGIYAVRVKIDGVWRDGVASFGRRPTFDFGAPLLETFVFDFSGDLYGRHLPVTFVRFLRPELAFDGMAALMAQMDKDSVDARAALAGLAPVSDLDAAINF